MTKFRPVHRLFVERVRRRWQAQCSCGFKGERRLLWGLAAHDGDKHLLDERPPPSSRLKSLKPSKASTRTHHDSRGGRDG